MVKTVREYYENPESRYGYKLFLKDAQHFGYYPNINDEITEFEAQNKLHDLLIEKLNLEQGDQVLDAGCGRGVVATYIAQRHDVKITGIDLVPYIIRKAINRAKKLRLSEKLNFINGSYSELQFDNNHFDKIYTVETLSHADNLELSLKELYRVLKPGGTAVFIEYEIAHFNKFSKYELEMYKIVRDGSAMNSLDEFVEGNFIKLLTNTGFELKEDLDITKNRSKSMKRLYNLALIPYLFIRLFDLRNKFINATAGVEYYKMNEKDLFRYHVYVVKKN